MEPPSEATDGSTVTFTLPNTPVSNTVKVFLNGALQRSGASYDYTISGSSVTFNQAPNNGDVVVASYFKALSGSGGGEEEGEEETVEYWFQNATAPSSSNRYQALTSPDMPYSGHRTRFGASVAISGDYLAAGAPQNASGGSTTLGAIQIFKKETYSTSSFTPDDLGYLALWLDASDTGSMTLVDEKVSVWADKSPVGNNAQCTTADQRPSITEDTLNGSDLVSFDGTQYLDLAKATYESVFWANGLGGTSYGHFDNNAPLTIFVVLKGVQNPDGEIAHVIGNDHSSVDYTGQYGDHLYVKADSLGSEETTYVVPNYESLFNYVGVSATGSSAEGVSNYGEANGSDTSILSSIVQSQGTSVYSNGAKIASDYTNNVKSVRSWSYSSIGAGRNPKSGTNSFHGLTGSIAEIIVYKNALADFQRKKVEQYLQTKWNLSVLPEDHDSGTDLGYVLKQTITGSTGMGYYLGGKYREVGTSATGMLYRTFSHNMSMTSNELFIGQPYANPSQTGKVYIHGKNEGGTDNWGKITEIAGPGSNSNFGNSLSVDGDNLLIGSYKTNGTSTDSGAAYLYGRNQGGTDNWGLVKTITESTAAYDYFGLSCDISGNYAIIGAGQDGPSNEGRAYIFSKDQGGTDNWGLIQTLTSSQANAYDFVGCSVAVSNGIAAVGIAEEDLYSGVSQAGAVYLYAKDQGGTDNWGFVKALTAPSPEVWDCYGTQVKLKENLLIVTMPEISAGSSAGYYNDHGKAFVYHRNKGGADNWGLIQTISGSHVPYGSETSYGYVSSFGSDCDLDQNTVAVSAGNVNYDAGLVQIYEVSGTS